MNLGDQAKDTVTGFEGIIIGKASYITGCDQCQIQPILKDGMYVDCMWYDVDRLEVTKKCAKHPNIKCFE